MSRSLRSADQLMLLAPKDSFVPGAFSDVVVDHAKHERLLAEVQTLRGSVYLEDGAIEPWQLTDGRHELDVDKDSWHLIALGNDGRVAGCARYLHHENTVRFSQLGIRHSALAECDQWGRKLELAVENELKVARENDLAYVEVGGWALIEELRCTTGALRIALATWALGQILGNCFGISTVTRRHCSSSILRKIGGRALSLGGTELPAYYDPQYKCDMEMLRFDSRSPNPKFVDWVNGIRTGLLSVPVVCGNADTHRWKDLAATMAMANRQMHSWDNAPAIA